MPGPDNSLPLNLRRCDQITLARGVRAYITFSFNAQNENAIIIYRAGTLEKLAERGNYRRGSSPFTFRNARSRPLNLIISGWHKNTPPNGSEPWHQSPMQSRGLNAAGLRIAEFEDSGDNDFNDSAAVYYSRATPR